MTLRPCRACGAATLPGARHCGVCGIDQPRKSARIGCSGCLVIVLAPMVIPLGALLIVVLGKGLA